MNLNSTVVVVDSATANDPLTLPGVHVAESALTGKKKETTSSSALPLTGAMARDENQVMKMPRKMFPAHVADGMIFEAETPDGDVALLRVVTVGLEEVTVDGNHPMAGETLNFSVEIIDVRESTPEDEDDGHGHDHEHGEGCSH